MPASGLGGCLPLVQGGSALGEGVSAPGGSASGPGGACFWSGGCLLWGVPASGRGVYPSMQ